MYLNVDEVDTAVINLASAFPSTCSLITLPNTTFEGRTTHALRLGGGAPGSRDCVTMIGGQHAREWGSCEILVLLASDLLTAFKSNMGLGFGLKTFTAAQIQTLINELHLVIFPLVNPDGRHFSQLHDPIHGNGGWRRNRNTKDANNDPNCIGVDLNRNYDFLFDLAKFAPAADITSHTSADHCDPNQTYQGPKPFSEPETQNVKWLLDTNPRTRWFVDVHSYSQDILYSWGDDNDQSTTPAMNFANPAFDGLRGVDGDAAYAEFIPADDQAVAVALATSFTTALQAVRGISYTAKSSYDLYPTCGTSDDYSYSRHVTDPSKGKIYAFTIEWGTEFRPDWTEMQNIVMDVDAGLIQLCLDAPCAAGLTAIFLETPAIVFEAVPAGVETSRAALFSVQTCGAVDLNVVSGPMVTSGLGSFTLQVGGASLPAASSAAERDVRLWVSFTGTSAGDVTTGTMTVHCTQTNQSYVIPITAHTIAQPKVASMLVLDKSGSMDDPSGIPNQKRIQVLHAAAPGYVALLSDADGVGIVSFDQDAHPVMTLEPAGALGAPAGGRKHATDKIAAHATNPLGTTSIGDGVELAHNSLPASGYDGTAIVVFTDGEENTAKLIADLPAGLIDDRVFAIGLGTVDEVNPVALNALVHATGGYLLLTDQLGPNDQFRLAKYFVQIVAGVTNAEIVVDPQGVVQPGAEVRIPFDLVESDYGADAIVLSPFPSALRFRLETPAGERIDHTALGGIAGVQFSGGAQLAFYRLSLPVLVKGTPAARGRWHVVLSTGKEQPGATFAASTGRGVAYSVVVHARSALAMDVFLTQPSYVAPTTLSLRAVLTEIGMPLENRAHVRAQVQRPDGTSTVVALAETEPGVFEATTPAPLNGIYPVRFRANGTSLRGFAFTREQTRTGMAWRGGDAPPPRTPPANHELCDLVRCLVADDGIRRWLETQHIDPKTLARCIEGACPKERR